MIPRLSCGLGSGKTGIAISLVVALLLGAWTDRPGRHDQNSVVGALAITGRRHKPGVVITTKLFNTKQQREIGYNLRISQLEYLFDKKSSRNTHLSMCICINCARVINCSAYHFVESKHEQPHINSDPTFTPREGSPRIHVNVRTVRTLEDRQKEAERMWRDHATETKQAAERNNQQDHDSSNNQRSDGELHGPTVYDFAPVTTYEYDVVACADFVNDVGCFVRNMPEEIRKANPNFVPS